MLDRTLLPFYAFFLRFFAPRYNAQIQLFLAQIRILRSRIDANRIVPTPEEKAEPPEKGTEIVGIPQVRGLHHRYVRRAA